MALPTNDDSAIKPQVILQEGSIAERPMTRFIVIQDLLLEPQAGRHDEPKSLVKL